MCIIFSDTVKSTRINNILGLLSLFTMSSNVTVTCVIDMCIIHFDFAPY